jgi:hypothetical protein
MRVFWYIALIVLSVSCAPDGKSVDSEKTENQVEEVVPENADAVGSQLFYWFYEDEFSQDEKEKLKEWIIEIGEVTFETLGDYPFDVEVTFHRSESDNPVPFGHTRRGNPEGVHFYVNPTFSLEELLEHWTAPHEIAHLSLPFSGPTSRWFSEGYATYLSRRIMVNMGYYSDQEFDSLYRSKIHEHMDYYGSSTKTHLEVSDSLMDHHIYSGMYWGSSSFFLTADSLLQLNHNLRFEDVVIEYQKCCRMEDRNLQDVMDSYDQIIGDTLFNSLMFRYRNSPCCEVMEGY